MEKTALITGGTKGIGRALVTRFAREGFHIISCSRSEPDLKKLEEGVLAENPGITFSGMVADLSQKPDVDSLVRFANQRSQSIEVLVNNAGVFLPGEIHSEDEGNLNLMMDTNLYSAYYLTRGILPQMLDRKRGHIFNMCSIASLGPYPQGSSYSISKFALLGFSKCLRREMVDYGIGVTSIIPGAVKTPSWDGVEIPDERFIKPEDIALAVWSAYGMSSTSLVEELVIRPQLGDI